MSGTPRESTDGSPDGSTPDERTRVYIMVDSITPSLDQIKAACGRVRTPRTEIGPGMGALTAATLDTVFGRLGE